MNLIRGRYHQCNFLPVPTFFILSKFKNRPIELLSGKTVKITPFVGLLQCVSILEGPVLIYIMLY